MSLPIKEIASSSRLRGSETPLFIKSVRNAARCSSILAFASSGVAASRRSIGFSHLISRNFILFIGNLVRKRPKSSGVPRPCIFSPMSR